MKMKPHLSRCVFCKIKVQMLQIIWLSPTLHEEAGMIALLGKASH
ncbi:hypothetical protein PB1_06827 [Bacillus methanolicus PB1]|uniref:Uncharacterized protein n=1 Tax=Bacillus methanolicus PB1 TaxID=997296 RepID=I3E0N2_BACMT|nr:hypothetical protein PB1_06827 [Bacillus methanolicus PB1]